MNLDIGAKKPIDGTQVFVVGRHLSLAEAPLVLLYDAHKRRRSKRNIQKMRPAHDPEPEDEHAGFLLFGMQAKQVSQLLKAS